jgi:hypothetical protein
VGVVLAIMSLLAVKEPADRKWAEISSLIIKWKLKMSGYPPVGKKCKNQMSKDLSIPYTVILVTI